MSGRPSPRVNVRLTGVLTTEGESAARVASVNLSETGILLRVARLLPLGASVELEFPEFKGGGVVIWNRQADDGCLIGVKFSSLGWRDRRKIRELVALRED